MSEQASLLPTDRPPYVVFDTETSGLFNFKLPADAPGQPRLASLSMIWTNPDLMPIREEMLYIKPEGWYMQPGAEAVNGLSQEFLMANGRPVAEALELYESAVREGYVFAAFNAQFDTKVMRAEFRRAGKDDLFEKVKNVCIMKKSVGVCKIPYADPKKGGYKFPKLEEARVEPGEEAGAPELAVGGGHRVGLISRGGKGVGDVRSGRRVVGEGAQVGRRAAWRAHCCRAHCCRARGRERGGERQGEAGQRRVAQRESITLKT